MALVSDTGMRLAEATGLALTDLVVEGDCKKVIIREHPWRRLKTAGSSREIPLVGKALWAAQRIYFHAAGQVHAFPRYNRGQLTNANSVSAASNKWLKPMVPTGCTIVDMYGISGHFHMRWIAATIGSVVYPIRKSMG